MDTREALEWAVKHYANPEINHVDYRVTVCKMAEKALTQPQPTGDVVERVARAIYSHKNDKDSGGENVAFDNLSKKRAQQFKDKAVLALSALPQQPALLQGMTKALENLAKEISELPAAYEARCADKYTASEVNGKLRSMGENCVTRIRALLAANALPPKSEVK